MPLELEFGFPARTTSTPTHRLRVIDNPKSTSDQLCGKVNDSAIH